MHSYDQDQQHKIHKDSAYFGSARDNNIQISIHMTKINNATSYMLNVLRAFEETGSDEDTRFAARWSALMV
jgi:hypothetical protein